MSFRNVVRATYRDRLAPSDLARMPVFADEMPSQRDEQLPGRP